MRFQKYIYEMAMPRELDLKKTYYHGTSTQRAAKGIMSKGISPNEILTQDQAKGFLKPVQGKVYITTNIRYALIYALGGDVIGSDYKMSSWEDEPNGYVFIIDGRSLKDIQPDEDSIGEMIYKKEPEWLYNYAKYELTDNQFKKVMDGEYIWWAKAGKKLVKKMSDEMKLKLIDDGAHIAHTGTLKPKEVFMFNKIQDNIKFKKDASNFFKVAKRKKL